MKDNIIWVGMDAHKNFISVALQPDAETLEEWQINNDPASVNKLVRKLVRIADGREIRACYEAGPCGFILKRQLEASGEMVCEIIAPSLIPQQAGRRVKTDRRDARKLMELYRADLLTAVVVPTVENEAVRDLCRCRDALKEDRARGRNRMKKWLLRRGISYPGGSSAWTIGYMRWLRTRTFEQPADRFAFEEYLSALEYFDLRISGLEERIRDLAETEPYREDVGKLRCFRGIDTLSAMVIMAELFDFKRFSSPRELMSYVGLVPSEYSSGGVHNRGRITKTGNRRLRTALVEAAWHYRHRHRLTPNLQKRRDGQPKSVIAVADRAGIRLSNRFWRLTFRGMPSTKAITAVARELLGFMWCAMRQDETAA
jgi:transposase